MAVINTQDSYAKMEFPLTIKRQDAFSMDPTETWPSLEAAQEYARSNPTAYVGQELAIIVNGEAQRYFIKNAAGDLVSNGGGGIDESSIASDAEVTEMLNEVFGE